MYSEDIPFFVEYSVIFLGHSVHKIISPNSIMDIHYTQIRFSSMKTVMEDDLDQ